MDNCLVVLSYNGGHKAMTYDRHLAFINIFLFLAVVLNHLLTSWWDNCAVSCQVCWWGERNPCGGLLLSSSSLLKTSSSKFIVSWWDNCAVSCQCFCKFSCTQCKKSFIIPFCNMLAISTLVLISQYL